MTEQPEALHLADALDAGENFYSESSLWYDRKLSDAVSAAAGKLRRQHREIERLRGIVPEALERLNDDLCNENEQLLAELRRLHAVNEELLVALRVLLNNNEWLTGESCARAAIAKAGGKV